MTSRFAVISSLALLLLANTVWATSPRSIEVHAPWVREAPPNATVLAAYLQLHNHGDKMHTLVGVKSAQFQRVELHRSAEKDGMATMAGISQVMIPAHGKVAFEPGGLHIMLIKPSHALVAGDVVTLTLTFSDGASLRVDAEVRRDIIGGKAHRHGLPASTTPSHNHDHGH